ncbi:SDR family oxidoreductase [Nocardioides ginsengisoli]|uniref:SDR family NAD(P)-dependent oxidoreductase n=1 Tax=Nocardioides ginsengisoli TaxID=363868 RepID=A0ABW3VUI5_9ACTN
MTSSPPNDTVATGSLVLAGRRTVVTGASRGIGRALAIGLAEHGADVLAVARSEADLAETVKLAHRATGSVTAHIADLSDPDEVEAVVARAVEVLGGIDILVNNAGTTQMGSIEQADLAGYQQVLTLNLQSCWLLCRAASDVLGEGASVINVASMLSVVASRSESAYIAAKHGLLGLTRALALEWARRGVRVNALGPGYVHTAMTDPGLVDDQYAAWVRKNTPMGRWAQPEEMVGPVVFLASPAASFVTGQLLVADGGWTAR